MFSVVDRFFHPYSHASYYNSPSSRLLDISDGATYSFEQDFLGKVVGFSMGFFVLRLFDKAYNLYAKNFSVTPLTDVPLSLKQSASLILIWSSGSALGRRFLGFNEVENQPGRYQEKSSILDEYGHLGMAIASIASIIIGVGIPKKAFFAYTIRVLFPPIALSVSFAISFLSQEKTIKQKCEQIIGSYSQHSAEIERAHNDYQNRLYRHLYSYSLFPPEVISTKKVAPRILQKFKLPNIPAQEILPRNHFLRWTKKF